MVETCVQHTLFWVERGGLFQIAHTQVTAKRDATRVVVFTARDDAEQCGFAGAVAGNESHTLTFGHREGYVVEEHAVADALGEMLYVEKRRHRGET